MNDASVIEDVNSKKGKKDLRVFFSGQYRKIVRSFEKRYGDLSQMEIEDVVSDLMADLLARADFAGRIENTGAYIYRAVQNRLIDYLRRRKKTRSFEKIADNFDAGIDVEAHTDSREIRRRLSAALARLRPGERAVWVATQIEGVSFRELAELWGVPIGTLLARKHRANAALQKHLSDLRLF